MVEDDLAPYNRAKPLYDLLAVLVDSPRFLSEFSPYVDGTLLTRVKCWGRIRRYQSIVTCGSAAARRSRGVLRNGRLPWQRPSIRPDVHSHNWTSVRRTLSSVSTRVVETAYCESMSGTPMCIVWTRYSRHWRESARTGSVPCRNRSRRATRRWKCLATAIQWRHWQKSRLPAHCVEGALASCTSTTCQVTGTSCRWFNATRQRFCSFLRELGRGVYMADVAKFRSSGMMRWVARNLTYPDISKERSASIFEGL